MNARSTKVVRCAIYTRVSTDQGLEQDFNSLDAQYDASQAYIRSQAHAAAAHADSGPLRRFSRLIVELIQWLAVKFPTQRNREFLEA